MDQDAFHRRALANAHVPLPTPGFRTIQLAKRHLRNAHSICVSTRQHPQPEHLEPVQGGHAVQIFVDRAHQHLPPKSLDGTRGLVFLKQPVEHRDLSQGFPTELLTTLGEGLTVAIAQWHTTSDLLAEDPIFSCQIRVAQAEFLIDGSRDRCQQLLPVHRACHSSRCLS